MAKMKSNRKEDFNLHATNASQKTQDRLISISV